MFKFMNTITVCDERRVRRGLEVVKPHYSRFVAKALERAFLVKRISLFARDSRDMREKRDWPEVSSS